VCAIFEDMLSKTCSSFISRLLALIVYRFLIKLVDQAGPKSQLEVCAIFEDMLSKTRSWQQQQQLSPLSGPDLAKLMKIGTRVIRQV
jgi:hypothetical protein